jgi:DNA segregation ATPase FtsK/SpoIIIE, S-DNA-T family
MQPTPTDNDHQRRFLSRPRLEKLLLGVLERQRSSAVLNQQQTAQLDQRLRELQSRHESERQELVGSGEQLKLAMITQWDEERCGAWDAAEVGAFRCASTARAGELNSRKNAKASQLRVSQEFGSKTAELEKRLQNQLDANNQKWSVLHQGFVKTIQSASEIRLGADLALAKLSLTAPTQRVDLPKEPQESADQALKGAEACIGNARRCLEQLNSMPLGNLFSSVLWWLLCLSLLAAATLILVLVAGWSPVVSFSTAAGITCAMVLIVMLGIKPWLKRTAETLCPQLQGQLQLAEHYCQMGEELATKERDIQQQRLQKASLVRRRELEDWRQSELDGIEARLHAELEAYWSEARTEGKRADEDLQHAMADIDRNYESTVRQKVDQSARQIVELDARYSQLQRELEDQMRKTCLDASTRLSRGESTLQRRIQAAASWYQEQFRTWRLLAEEKEAWPVRLEPTVLPIGLVGPANLRSEEEEESFSASFVAQPEIPKIPFFFSTLEDGYLVIHADPKRKLIQQLVRTILLRALTTLPAGKTQVCVVDPSGLGQDFGWLMALGDFEPALVHNRVWTQTSHIATQLQLMVNHAEDFIQQALRNRYEHIWQYNRDAAGLAEPFRLLVWNGLPTGLDEHSWGALQSLCDSGARCGIIPILVIDPALGWSGPQKDWLMRRGLHLTMADEQTFLYKSRKNLKLVVHPEEPPSESQTDQMINGVALRAREASRVEIPLAQIIGPSLAAAPAEADHSGYWSGDSSNLLEIPFATAGVSRKHSLRLGIGTAQHAVIAGKTGSGKSSLLHAIITSAVLKYSPENLRLVLLDFKKGVEFQIYSDARLPHADIIGIESHREFGLSALQRIDECLQQRGEMFRSAAVQDISGWNQARPDQALPRVLIIIDEFQELFIEDDKLSHSASMILDRIVRQGRSFGVHAILSSQTLAGSYSIPRATLSQMAVRIALVCDPSDAQIIFSDDNPAASRLRYPGQAIYNDAGGRIEGNQPIQVGWVDQKDQLDWFSRFPKEYRNPDPTTNRLGHTVVYEGNRPAPWRPESVELAIFQASKSSHSDSIWCAAGESVSIHPAVVFPITKQSGRNALLVGGDDKKAFSVLNLLTHSFVRSCIQQQLQPQLVAFLGAKPSDQYCARLGEIWSRLPCKVTVRQQQGLKNALEELHQILQQRISEQPADAPPILVPLIQIGRFADLRREDEFSFGQTGETPDKVLEILLREGPSYGMHFLIWAESHSVVTRWLHRGSLRELEIRLLMQMSPGDSSNLADSVAAAQLGESLMLLVDQSAGVEQRFRPVDPGQLESLDSWVRSTANKDGLD